MTVGSKDRNRALEGDVVAIELLDVCRFLPRMMSQFRSTHRFRP